MANNTKPQKEPAEDGGSAFQYDFDLDDIRILLNALKQYKPTKDEEQVYEILLEDFEEEMWVDEHKDDEDA
jgi:hypothetical protein